MRRMMFIVNPVAGNGRAKDLMVPLHEKMVLAGLQYELHISSSKGNVETLASEGVRNGFNEIIGIGGDGTLLEIINGIRSEGGKDVIIGIVPSGTGNDFARVLHQDTDPVSVLDTIIRGHWTESDLPDCNGTKFINVCAMGIDGQIILDTEKIKKKIPGPTAYLISTIKALLLFQPRKVRLSLDGVNYTKRVLIIAVGNGQYVGGGMRITPRAEINDGLLDVCVVNSVPKLRLLILFPSIFKGEHLKVKEVEYFRCREIEVESIERTLLVNVDGTIIGTTPAKIQITDEKIRVFCDPS
jgi:YegS/Rv2252/BmrU family lipid kinase